MFLEKILWGLSWGLGIVALLVPVCSFTIAWSWLRPILNRPKEVLADVFEEEFEEEPPLPENPPSEEPPQRYRFVASTIVRPPNIIRRKDSENED